ncbi:glycoside hydrolase family 13 protein [Nesterenkonia lacusekhoensis]|uniref:Alpha-glucosidase n=1 Tax=Nesterenkonia lacusekhoensis TaxID=150832 RepID=A0ABS4SY91_9MICC|nr:glycoside hydrolase family 13 protein [Nesterenkonia lacusekhoensis]MBP2317162.1 alpha-glucosidase [Nesterenkonia lacusekhoensis]
MTSPTSQSAAATLHVQSPEQTEWWRHAVIYQIYPRSFADGDGDGMGDLPGITSRLDHLAQLGVDAIWLSPFYRSPQNDAGYDVADYRDIDPLFGTLEDADELIDTAHSLGIRVVVDLVPNHTSDQHAWFRAALAAGPGSPERERYMFREGAGPDGAQPPNNWESLFGGPAWTRVREREDAPGSSWAEDGQWYLNLFDTSQPDLNWENPEVHREFDDILRFWLDRGVDGFRVDVAHGMIKAEGLPDWSGHVEMVSGAAEAADAPGDNPGMPPYFDQDGVHEIYRHWRTILDEYSGDRMLVAEAWVDPLERLARYVRADEMHQAFNFAFLTQPWEASALRATIAESYAVNDSVSAPTTWVLSNHDVVRHASRMGFAEATNSGPNKGIGPQDPQPDRALGLRRARAASLLMLGLPGSAYLYQGDELALPEHTTLPAESRQDPTFFRTDGEERGRDGCRVPIPWEAGAPAYGFSSTGKSWLPQPDDWDDYAVSSQRGDAGSTLELHRQALRLRREYGLGTASLADEPQLAGAGGVLALVSSDPAGERADVLLMANTGSEPVELPAGWTVVLSSAADAAAGSSSGADGVVVPADTTVWAVRG